MPVIAFLAALALLVLGLLPPFLLLRRRVPQPGHRPRPCAALCLLLYLLLVILVAAYWSRGIPIGLPSDLAG